jgi:hypothetical protein
MDSTTDKPDVEPPQPRGPRSIERDGLQREGREGGEPAQQPGHHKGATGASARAAPARPRRSPIRNEPRTFTVSVPRESPWPEQPHAPEAHEIAQPMRRWRRRGRPEEGSRSWHGAFSFGAARPLSTRPAARPQPLEIVQPLAQVALEPAFDRGVEPPRSCVGKVVLPRKPVLGVVVIGIARAVALILHQLGRRVQDVLGRRQRAGLFAAPARAL